MQEAVSDGVIEGRNAVIEALQRRDQAIDKIYLAKGETDKTLVTSPRAHGTRASRSSSATAASLTPCPARTRIRA